MVNNNKILTVSYGTFSCTLEGFEDSFGTMTAIAEYFRDLAADDRYFGAEPPQPDADMLAQISQRSMARRVEVTRDRNGYVLRAEEPAEHISAPAAAAAAADAVQAPKAVPVAPTAPLAPVHAAAPAAFVAQAEMIPSVAATGDSIAAKLQRIRAVVSKNEAAAQDAVYTEDEHAESFMASTADDIAQAMEEDDRAMRAAGLDVAFEDDGEDNDALAAAIARIGDVPDQHEVLQEDTVALAADHEDLEDDDADLEDAAAAAMAEDEDDAAEDEDLMAPAAVEAVADHEDDDEDDVFADFDPTVDDDILNAVRDLDDNTDDTDTLFLDLDADLDADIDEDEIANILDDDALRPAVQGRVIKVKRAEFDAAIAAGDIEPETDSALSAEEEADLLRELADVQAEATEARGPEDANIASLMAGLVEADDAAQASETAAAEVAVSEPFEDEDDDLSRLMAAAQERMAEPETSSARDTYSHLRAAVAAAEAERSSGGDVNDASDDDVYREDLASVVRPRRPTASSTLRPNRPVTADTRPAPLKLVAEQRIDSATPSRSQGPVRPRRIASNGPEEFEILEDSGTDGGFAKFATEVGATELPELLEAAAAYLSFVEGRDQFSRPQLMSKVRQIESSDFNREDGLRSFGQLLREGKIEKTSGGRFTASEDIGFHPGKRAAG